MGFSSIALLLVTEPATEPSRLLGIKFGRAVSLRCLRVS